MLTTGVAVSESDTNIRTIRDLCGREVTVPKQVERVVAIGPGALRFVAYLGAVDKIVGIENLEKKMNSAGWLRPYALVLSKEFMKLPVVSVGGPGKLPNFEAVMLTGPDVIVTVSSDPSQLNNLEQKTGVPTVFLTYGELGVWRKEAKNSLKLLGKILGKVDRAQELIRYIELAEADLKKRTETIEKKDKPSVYFGGISLKGAHDLTSTEAGYAPGTMVNAVNVVDTLEKAGHLFIDKEQIMVWAPDAIFIDLGSRNILERDFMNNRQFYRLLKAVRTNRVFSLLPYNYYNTNLELALLNAYFIGKTLYPGQFEDIDIRKKADEIYRTFLGIKAPDEIPAYRAVQFPEHGEKILW